MSVFGLLRLNVFQKIAAGYVVVLVILVGTAVTTFSKAQASRAEFQALTNLDVPALITLNDLRSAAYLEEQHLELYANSSLVDQAREDLLISYFAIKTTMAADVARLHDYAATKQDLAGPFAGLKAAVQAREADAAGDMAQLRAGGLPFSILLDNDGLVAAVERAAEVLAESVDRSVEASAAAASANAMAGMVLIIIFCFLGVAVTIVAGLWSARSISKPLGLLTHSAERIARGEPLEPPRLARSDEIGVLSAAVAQMVDSLREVTAKEQAVVAEHKKVQVELTRSNAELEQFAYIASHDLQEPLRMVSSYTSLLKRRYAGKLDADADEFMAFAIEGATRMRALINDLLTYSRVGREAKPSVPTDSRLALDRALANLQIAIADKGAAVKVGRMPSVMGDLAELTQIFQNLIGNGLKFCKKDHPEIRVGAEEHQGEWIFSVADNGIGILPEFRDRIFLIFQRLHKREEYEGTGIGLAICKKIVERHGGRIWVESEPGQGATFRFTLHPLHDLNELEAAA
ncbi:MAG: ATP-binding protein [Candidatus Dormibacteraeota bacterium]|nr:ATP-binding protein [Candidatus Dormibacteraeota bacterium]